MFRTIFNIIIILFVITSLYIMRSDVRILYNRFVGFIENVDIRVGDALDTIPNKNTANKENIINDTIIGFKNIITTPGALRVPDSFSKGVLSTNGIISFTNKERVNVGLPNLVENAKLNMSASKKVDDMFANQYFEHVSPSGVGVSHLGQSVGYEYIIIGENLALGNFKDDNAVVQAWMASPGHKANILNKNYIDIGVSAKKGIFEGKEVWLIVQHFGTQKDVCPTINPVLKASIQADQAYLKVLQGDLAERQKKIDSGAVVDGKTTEEQIQEYNQIVTKYNALVIKTKNNIDIYNKQINAFNMCVEKAQ